MVSMPGNLIVTGCRCQPAAFGSGSGSGTRVGAVLSILNVLVTLVSATSVAALQDSVWPAVSAVSVLMSQPSVSMISDSGSEILHLTVTFVTYQPWEPSVPVISGTTTGGVGSPGTSGRPAAPGDSSRPPIPRSRSAACRRTRSA